MFVITDVFYNIKIGVTTLKEAKKQMRMLLEGY
jgi:hypothetical protein